MIFMLASQFHILLPLVKTFGNFLSKLYSLPGGVGDAEAEVLPVLGHQLLHHGGLARAAGPAQHQGPGRRRRGRAPEVIWSYCHVYVLWSQSCQGKFALEEASTSFEG